MSDLKRATLISFETHKVGDKSCKETQKTIRIQIELPESTEDSYPEYNYKDELAAAKKKFMIKSVPSTNGLDPFNDDDDDVRRIAQQMEAKYGTVGAHKKKKKKSWKKDDYADIGMGYDESDSFIDNTDGYDEMVPKNVTTLHGGFYINCGALEFKTDEELSSEDDSSDSGHSDAPASKSPGRKRVLESSAESDADAPQDGKAEGQPSAEKKPKLENGMQKALKKRLFSHDKIKQLKQSKTEEKKRTVRELLKAKREDLNMTVVDGQAPPNNDSTVTAEAKKDTVDDAIESVISAIDNGIRNEEDSSKDSASSKEAKSAAYVSSEGDSNDGCATPKIVELPENLPKEVAVIIESLKTAAATSTKGKVKFFAEPAVTKTLLSLENKCRCLGRQSRFKVYEHLAPFLRCKKETLMKRAKNLVISEEEAKVDLQIEKLKSTIDAMMPAVLDNYEREVKKMLENRPVNGIVDDTPVRMPKRHFPWNEDLKKTLRDVTSTKKRCYIMRGKNKHLLESDLIKFLKEDVHRLWPDGWMSMSSLVRVCCLVLDNNKKGTTPKPLAVKKINGPSSGLTIIPIPPILSTLPETAASKQPQDKPFLAPKIRVKDLEELYPPQPATTITPKVPLKDKEPKREEKRLKEKETVPENLKKISYMKKDADEKKADTNAYQVIDLTESRSKVSAELEIVDVERKPISSSSEGDDIQKVMEDLKALQKLSSPAKSDPVLAPGSPVSVIAFSKSQPPKTRTPDAPKAATTTFQDAFQKQFIQEFNSSKNAFLSSKSSGTVSSSKYPSPLGPQNSHKGNNKLPYASNQLGTYKMLDDMVANLLGFPYSRPDNHSSSSGQQQQHK